MEGPRQWICAAGIIPVRLDRCASTTTVTDKPMGKVVGEPYRGKLDVRFDEGDEGIAETKVLACTGALLYWGFFEA